jgi:hypothetical protein
VCVCVCVLELIWGEFLRAMMLGVIHLITTGCSGQMIDIRRWGQRAIWWISGVGGNKDGGGTR